MQGNLTGGCPAFFIASKMSKRYQAALHLCAIAATLPFLVLAAYCHPYFDDYGTALSLKGHDFWPYFTTTYQNWTGRYAFLLANAVYPLRFGDLGTYQFSAGGLVAGLVGACYALSIGLTAGSPLRWSARLALGSGIVVAVLVLLPSSAEGFYWVLAGYNYLLAILVGFGGVAAGCLYAAQRPGNRWLPISAAFASAALFPGFSEFTACLTLALAAGFLVAFPHANRTYRALVVVAVIGAVFMLASPGNFGRLHKQPHEWLIAQSVVLAGKATAYTLLNWLAFPVFWLLAALGLPLFEQLAAGTGPTARLTRNPLLWPLLLVTGVAGCYLFSYLAIHQPIPLRARNILYCYFLLTALLSLVGIIQRAQRHARAFPHLPPPLLLGLLVIVLLSDGNGRLRNATIGSGSNTIAVAYRDWLSGDARRFDDAERARYALLRSTRADSVAIAPLPVSPPSLLYYDLGPSPGLWSNRVMAFYFGKKAVWLDWKLAATPPKP